MQHLLSDFEFANITQWERQVLNDLGLENIEQLTQIQLSENITQSPYSDFTSNPPNQFQHSYRYCTANSGKNWQGSRYWLIMERYEGLGPSEINQLSLASLTGGADGIIIATDGVIDWEQLLTGVSLSDCHLGVDGALPDILDLVEFLDSLGKNHQGFFIINDLPELLENENPGLLDLLNRDSGFRMLILQELVTEPGTIDELALLLSQGIFTINTLLEADIPMPAILENIQLNIPLGDSYLWEICRLRCLRILFHQVVQQYGTTDYLPGSLTIQATTTGFQSPPASASTEHIQRSQKAFGDGSGKQKKSTKESFSTFGQNQQLLRNTVQTMAAVLGGCNIITVVPHKNGFGSNDQWSRRIARNVCHILKDESNLHKMADPVAGSYYLENLTDKMLREVWARLQQIEGTGGYLKRRESRI